MIYNESENISGESIGDAALIRGWCLLTFLSQMRRFFKGGANSSKYGRPVTSTGWRQRLGKNASASIRCSLQAKRENTKLYFCSDFRKIVFLGQREASRRLLEI